MTNPPCIIWRSTTLTGGKGTEGNADSSIKFELLRAPATDSTGHVHSTSYRLKSGIGENEKVFGPGNELQDTKFEGFTTVINGSVEIQVPQGWSGAGTQTLNVTQSKIWLVEDKVNSAMPKGRFGIRTDDFPFFNLSPTVNWGIIIQDWEWTRIGEQRNRADFIATLRFNFGSVGSSPYDWS